MSRLVLNGCMVRRTGSGRDCAPSMSLVSRLSGRSMVGQRPTPSKREGWSSAPRLGTTFACFSPLFRFLEKHIGVCRCAPEPDSRHASGRTELSPLSRFGISAGLDLALPPCGFTGLWASCGPLSRSWGSPPSLWALGSPPPLPYKANQPTSKLTTPPPPHARVPGSVGGRTQQVSRVGVCVGSCPN